jgi:transketolase
MHPSLNLQELQIKSIQYRKTVLSIIKHARAGHTGGSLSSIDILNVLYNRILRLSPATFRDLDRDRFVQSKGHSVEALYTVLADCGASDYRSHGVSRPIGASSLKVRSVRIWRARV